MGITSEDLQRLIEADKTGMAQPIVDLMDQAMQASDKVNKDNTKLAIAKEKEAQQENTALTAIKKKADIDPVNAQSQWSKEFDAFNANSAKLLTLIEARQKEIAERDPLAIAILQMTPFRAIFEQNEDKAEDELTAAREGVAAIAQTIQARHSLASGAATTQKALQTSHSAETNALFLEAEKNKGDLQAVQANMVNFNLAIKNMDDVSKLWNTTQVGVEAKARAEGLKRVQEDQAYADEIITIGAKYLGFQDAGKFKHLPHELKLPIYLAGLRVMAGSASLANSPGDAALAIAEVNSPLADNKNSAAAMLTNVLRTAPAGTKKAELPDHVNSFLMGDGKTTGYLVKSKTDMETNLYPELQANNLFKAPDATIVLTELSKSSPNFVDTPLYQKVIKPLAGMGAIGQIGNPNFSFEQLLETAKEALTATDLGEKKSGLTEANVADGIIEYYKAAVKVNNDTKQFARVGLQPQTEYNVYVPDLIGRSQINALNKSAVILRLRKRWPKISPSAFSGLSQ